MGKILTAYRGYTATEIKAKADIPAQANMSISEPSLDCWDISLNACADLVGDATHSLKETCLKANKWSGFSPSHISYLNSGTLSATLRNELESPYSLGAFAGYNHDAAVPSLDHYYFQSTVNQGSSATVDAYINIGEVRYPSPAAGLALTLWNGANLLGFGITSLSNLESTNCFVTAETGALNANTTVTAKVFIIDSTTEFVANGSNVLCKVPNVADGSQLIYALAATSFILEGIDAADVSGEGYNLTNGTVSWDSAIYAQAYIGLEVRARLTNWNNSVNENILMFSGDVSANTTFYPDTSPAQFTTVPIPAYGYYIRLEFNVPN